ncbi:MmcQ/YjbR family DNA-binding protein [Rossellomorea aquimaris]|uniref:MmcQ/YjbR family DNA-binding protein n=1 Tax=Rossellomorea aquimaris TaxID=189382 RepID=UPI000B2403A2|nr:MmcQ/YjbR family DNA-binding protein [Rossellomorea aquimaris]
MLVDRVREVCMAFPTVDERVDGFGHTSFRVKDKPFVILEEQAELSLSIKVPPTTQDILLEQTGFRKAPYIGRHGWIVVEIEEVNWKQIADLIREGYVRVAPKKLANEVLNG